jgi:misacylated tRNA(Ala) deacylase
MTEEIFRQNAYVKECEARVTAADDAGIHLDRTVFYPMGGGQPGDTGVLRLRDGSEIRISDTRKDQASGNIVHIPETEVGADLAGKQVVACIDWERRHRLMRMHTLMQFATAAVDSTSICPKAPSTKNTLPPSSIGWWRKITRSARAG